VFNFPTTQSITPITLNYIGEIMPIDIERFVSDPADELQAQGSTNAELILSFLASSPEQAYTPKEIHEATDVPRGSVGVVLSRLEDRELVRHKGDYWAVAADGNVSQTVNSMRTANTVSERFGPEDPDEWGENVEASTGDSE
jgi:hypothetical protein